LLKVASAEYQAEGPGSKIITSPLKNRDNMKLECMNKSLCTGEKKNINMSLPASFIQVVPIQNRISYEA